MWKQNQGSKGNTGSTVVNRIQPEYKGETDTKESDTNGYVPQSDRWWSGNNIKK